MSAPGDADDNLTPPVQALAQILAANVAGLGRVYDQTDADPTSGAVSLEGGKPSVLFIAPYTWDYSIGGELGLSSFGEHGRTTDRHTILVVIVFGSFKEADIGRFQQAARPYPNRIKRAVVEHNTLNSTVWRARVLTGQAGPFPWGNVEWYTVRVPVVVEIEQQLTPHD